MKSRIKWGLATLIILLIGVSVFLLTRMPETEPEIVYKSPTPEEKAEVDRNIQDAIDKAKKNQPQIAEIEHQEAPHKNSQQNDSVENVNDSDKTVTVKNYLEGITEIDFFDSITIPTDAQLANYTDAEATKLYKELHEGLMQVDTMQSKYIERRKAVGDALDDVLYPNPRPAESSQLLQQMLKLERIIDDLIKQHRRFAQELKRVADHQRSLG